MLSSSFRANLRVHHSKRYITPFGSSDVEQGLSSIPFSKLLLAALAILILTVANASTAPKRWAALAVGSAPGNLGRAHTDGAFGIGSTKREAETNAVGYCEDSGFVGIGQITCAIKMVWSDKGCKYGRLGEGFLRNGQPVSVYGYGSSFLETSDAIFHYFNSAKITRIKLHEVMQMCISSNGWFFNGRPIKPFSNSFRFRYF
jgi:hypothetical protein